MTLFPFADYWWFYGAFTLIVLGLLVLDLGLFHRKAHAVSFREAAAWSAVWIALALAFNYGFYRYALWRFDGDSRVTAATGLDAAASAKQVALEFLTGYIIEKSLSVDNIFVFVVVFGFFAIPSMYQHRILYFGILGALVFRAAFIAAGAVLMQYQWVIWVFGGFLVLTGIKMLTVPEKPMDPEKNPVIRMFRKAVPVTAELHGQRFFVRLGGAWHATPLFLTLLFIEVTDIIFAVDSVPAIFAVTKEPLIVFTSNVFAILGLRALYFLLAGAIESFHMLRYGLAVILIFVGLKMAWLNHVFGGKFPIGVSLGIIGGVLAVSVALSFLFPRRGSART